MSLTGKVAVVTGAAQGIGKAIALTLAQDGADIVVSDINLEKAKETAKEIEALERKALAIQTNVAKGDDVETLAKTTLETFNKVDIIVNNAGITRDNLLMRMKDEEWDQVLEVNLKGTFYCTRAFLRSMLKQKSGRIVNITSVVGAMGNAGQANYSASKAGVIGFTKTIAREVASRSITVNAVAPGFIDTDMTKGLPEEVRKNLLNQIPLGRLGTPQDIAEAVRFLVSEEAAYITGQIIHVNGGMLM